MKVAVTSWEDHVSPVFDVCREMRVFTVVDGEVHGAAVHFDPEADPASKIQQIAERGIGTLICGAISSSVRDQLVEHGIRVLAFAAGHVEEVLQAFLAGDLARPDLVMPGCNAGSGFGGQPAHGKPSKGLERATPSRRNGTS